MDWTSDGHRAGLPREPADPRYGASVLAVVEQYDDAPNECTLYPAVSSDMELMTRWITARGNAFVELKAKR